MRRIDGDALIEFIENRYVITWKDDYEGGIKDACTDILEKISKMPTIEPERKKGKWIMLDKGLIVTSYKCSECGRTVRDDTGYDVSKDYPFCHCGANMRGESGG